jgi:hypothetical protein
MITTKKIIREKKKPIFLKTIGLCAGINNKQIKLQKKIKLRKVIKNIINNFINKYIKLHYIDLQKYKH